MALNQRKYEHKHEAILRDVRPFGRRMADGLASSTYSTSVFIGVAVAFYISPWALAFGDLIMVIMFLFFLWLLSRDRSLAFKLPKGAKFKDKNNSGPGRNGKAEGILYLGNVEKTNEEVWFTNSDARTHILYLGTTGAGKTEGLKSMVTNALAWGSGFVYVDGKADTDLWSSLSSLVRRFGRDDDLMVLNYMTGNSDIVAPSNTMNPFSSGSASYLVNMLVSLMPESEGDNAMWKERAVSLVGSMMPALTWKRDHQEMPLSVRTIRDYLSLNNVIKLQRDEAVPAITRAGIKGYLDTLPGFVHDAFDDQGAQKPPGPGQPAYDTTTANQQHGYLAMQFTRSLQSLGDDYGYIFDTQAADVDMVDVVLNRRILIVLIPALEKSGDEIANLGKIVAATIKGMMGSTLGANVEGDSASVIENKPTHSATPFMTVFDEVGYYTAAGMAVMAAQARSLGFCLVFSGQDLPAMKKRVREEANSIVANCNIKIFGKLEDPTETKDFFEKTVGSAIVTEVSGFQMAGGTEFGNYYDTQQAGVQLRPRASYDGLRAFKEGQAVITFGEVVTDARIFYCNPGFAKAMRVTRYMCLPQPNEQIMKHAGAITKLRDLLVNKTWTAERADVALETPKEIAALDQGFKLGEKKKTDPVNAGIMAIVQVHGINNSLEDATPPPPSAPTPPPASSTPPTGAAPPRIFTPPLTSPPVTAAPSTPPITQPPAASAPPASVGPMGFFAPKKTEETAQAAPPVPQQPVSTPPAAPPAAVIPSIFAKTPPAAPPAASPVETPAAPPATAIPSIFTKAPSSVPADAPTSQAQAPVVPAPTETPAAPATGEPEKAKLPKAIQDLIENAGKDTKKEIFKDKDDIDAAE